VCVAMVWVRLVGAIRGWMEGWMGKMGGFLI
jgi:hypothetical protein